MNFNRIFVLGAGAIGSAYGAMLSRRNDVTLIGAESQVEVVNSEGLRVSGDVKEVFHVKADTAIRQLLPERSLVLLTTKAYDSEKAVESIRPFVRKDTVILVLQNGLGNEQTVRRIIAGRCKAIRAVTSAAAELAKLGQVRFRKGETVIEQAPEAQDVARTFNECLLSTRISGDMQNEVWTKLVANCVINPLTAILRVRTREIGAESLKPVRRTIVDECTAVGHAERILFPADLTDKIDHDIQGYVNYSSMCQDLMNGRHTEIDFINGKIVELGNKHGISTPANLVLTCLIKFAEGKR